MHCWCKRFLLGQGLYILCVLVTAHIIGITHTHCQTYVCTNPTYNTSTCMERNIITCDVFVVSYNSLPWPAWHAMYRSWPRALQTDATPAAAPEAAIPGPPPPVRHACIVLPKSLHKRPTTFSSAVLEKIQHPQRTAKWSEGHSKLGSVLPSLHLAGMGSTRCVRIRIGSCHT